MVAMRCLMVAMVMPHHTTPPTRAHSTISQAPKAPGSPSLAFTFCSTRDRAVEGPHPGYTPEDTHLCVRRV